jgi:hypothetical protein
MGLELGGAQPLLHNLSSFQPFNQTENWITATTFYSSTKHKKWLSLTRWLGISSSPKGYPLNQTAPKYTTHNGHSYEINYKTNAKSKLVLTWRHWNYSPTDTEPAPESSETPLRRLNFRQILTNFRWAIPITASCRPNSARLGIWELWAGGRTGAAGKRPATAAGGQDCLHDGNGMC